MLLYIEKCEKKLYKTLGSVKCAYCRQDLNNIKEEKKYLYRCPFEDESKPIKCYDENCGFMHLTTKNRKWYWPGFKGTN